uniref:EF-hand domain-containing protein n=1 Tax=Macrostomum lignano TaxID=282301 RepID=A0A1I8FHX3_9PLAT
MADLSKFDQGLVAEYREAFALFDKDGDGCITTKDLGRVMRSLGQEMPDSQLQAIGAVANARRNVADKDGRNQRSDKRSAVQVDFSEFVALMETRKTEDELRSENNTRNIQGVRQRPGWDARNAASKQRNELSSTRIKVHLEPKSHVMLRRCFKIETLLRRAAACDGGSPRPLPLAASAPAAAARRSSSTISVLIWRSITSRLAASETPVGQVAEHFPIGDGRTAEQRLLAARRRLLRGGRLLLLLRRLPVTAEAAREADDWLSRWLRRRLQRLPNGRGLQLYGGDFRGQFFVAVVNRGGLGCQADLAHAAGGSPWGISGSGTRLCSRGR